MQDLNHTLFLAIHAAVSPGGGLLLWSMFAAVYLIAAVPLTLVAGWLWGREPVRRHCLEAGVAGCIALLIAFFIGWVWPQPRPFVLAWGQQWLAHAADASFPSDHLTLVWSVAASLIWHRRTRTIGTVLAVSGIPMAWARIYLGVHSPLDMLGAMLVAVAGASAARRVTHRWGSPLYSAAHALYGWVMAPCIRRNWVRA